MGHKHPDNHPQQHHGSENLKDIGGREFGQVIEPTQAQQASGNKGLADDQSQSKAKKPHTGKKAA